MDQLLTHAFYPILEEISGKRNIWQSLWAFSYAKCLRKTSSKFPIFLFLETAFPLVMVQYFRLENLKKFTKNGTFCSPDISWNIKYFAPYHCSIAPKNIIGKFYMSFPFIYICLPLRSKSMKNICARVSFCILNLKYKPKA